MLLEGREKVGLNPLVGVGEYLEGVQVVIFVSDVDTVVGWGGGHLCFLLDFGNFKGRDVVERNIGYSYL